MEKEPFFSFNWEEDKEKQEKKKAESDARSLAEYATHEKEKGARDRRRTEKQFTDIMNLVTLRRAIERKEEIPPQWFKKAEAIIAAGNVWRKLNADPEEGEVPKEKAAYHLLSGLKSDIVDPLNEEFPGARVDKEILGHYTSFLFPGRNVYGKMKAPRSTSYEIQREILQAAGTKLTEENVQFFEPGMEEKLPPGALRNALKIYVSDEEKEIYRADHKEIKDLPGTTWILYAALRGAGCFEKLKKSGKINTLEAMALFADVLERRGDWLDFASENFFDKSKINLFKINLELSGGKIRELMNDLMEGIPHGRIQEAVVGSFSRPLREMGNQFIKEHGLGEPIKIQEREIDEAKQYLVSGRNIRGSRFGNVIFTNAGDRLPGQLAALNARPPFDERKQPKWEQPRGYFEMNEMSFLGYLRKSDSKKFLERLAPAAEESGLNLRVTEISGWVKMFISFNGKPNRELKNKIENDWLRISKTSKEKPRRKEREREEIPERALVR